MRDILIDFLEKHLMQQYQLLQNMQEFLNGLTGKPPGTVTNHPVPPLRQTQSMICTFVHGNYKLYEHVGGDKQTQAVSDPQAHTKETEEMKYISKRADGRWVARKTIDGKRICVYGKTQKEASEKLRALSGKKIREPKREPLGKFATWWLDTYKKGNVSESTYKNYSWTISAHLADVTTPINKVTTVQLQALLNGMPASRIRKEVYKLLRQIFRKAYELDFIKKDVSEFLTVGKVEEKSRDALSIEEQRKLVASLSDDMFSRRVMFYLCTGARPGEIATVRKEELRPGWVKINGTKTKSAVRWVKISAKLSAMLAGESPEFFHFDNKRFRQRLQQFCDVHGICRKIDVYTLRHTFATNLYILRVPEKDRQTYMGHTAGSAMTNQIYTTFSPDTTAQDIYDIYGDFYPEF